MRKKLYLKLRTLQIFFRILSIEKKKNRYFKIKYKKFDKKKNYQNENLIIFVIINSKLFYKNEIKKIKYRANNVV